nr:MAG TPA: hypothetical protein [Caudoviricetes sp.]
MSFVKLYLLIALTYVVLNAGEKCSFYACSDMFVQELNLYKYDGLLMDY